MDSKYLLRYHSPMPGYHLQWFPTVFCHPISTGARQQHQGKEAVLVTWGQCAGRSNSTSWRRSVRVWLVSEIPGLYSLQKRSRFQEFTHLYVHVLNFTNSTHIQDYQYQSCSLTAGALIGEFKIILACLIFPALPASVWSDSRAGFRIVLFCCRRDRIFWLHLSERSKFHPPTSCLLCLL